MKIENRIYKPKFWVQASQNFIQKEGLDAVTVLAYASLVGLVPFLTIIFSVFSMSGSFDSVQTDVMDKIMHYLLPESTPKVEFYLRQFSEKARELQGVGIMVMLFIALILLWTVDKKINLMWSKHLQRTWWVSLLRYLGVSIIGPILLGFSLVLNSMLMAGPLFPVLQEQTWALNQAPVLINILGFAFIYHFVPIHPVKVSYAFIGALLASLELELLKFLFSFYVDWFPTVSIVYGAFAVIPLFLFWLYLLWFVIIFNASVVHQLTLERGPMLPWRKKATR